MCKINTLAGLTRLELATFRVTVGNRNIKFLLQNNPNGRTFEWNNEVGMYMSKSKDKTPWNDKDHTKHPAFA